MSEQPRILALFGARVIFGAERENIESLAALREQGCEILCLVRHEAWNDAIPKALAARGLACAPIPYIDGWLPGWRLWITLRDPIAFIVGNLLFLKIVRDFRPTHIHAFNSLHVLSFLAGLMVVQLPMVYRAGDLPVSHRRIWRLLWRFITWRTQRFVAVSKFIAREIVSTGVDANRVEIIYGALPRRFSREEEVNAAPAADPKIRDIIFVGQINENKGPHLLIQAFRTLVEVSQQGRLLIVGRISQWKGDDWVRDLRDSVARDPVLSSRVVFVGYVENVPAVLQGRTVLVAPSLQEEPLGLVVIEAKAAALPAIVFPSGGLPEMIEHGIDGFICRDKSVEALAEALNLYLADPSLTLRQGLAAKKSLFRLGSETFADSWLAVYKRTM
jgi:glycosyltransferase involved in cell wall biosynthesis